jgi:4'-phosphopantetheinyl transferase
MTIAMRTIADSDAEWPPIRLPLTMCNPIVHVVRVRLNLPADEIAQMLELLDNGERKRANRFRFDEPRHRFICCRATLRQLLGSCCGISAIDVPLSYGVHGKPNLARDRLSSKVPPVEFSVSHSGDVGLIALGISREIGVDLEEFNPRINAMKLADRFFTKAETDELRSLAEEKQLQGFYHGWTCKEAYLKATGRGLSLPLNSFSVSMDPEQPSSLLWVEGQSVEPEAWTMKTLNVSRNHAAAVIVAQGTCQFQCWDWNGIKECPS